MKGIKIDVPYDAKTTRMEMVYRILYCIAYGVIASVLGTVISFVMLIQFLIMVITATRHEQLNHYIHVYIVWVTEISAYIYFLTDERPNLIPQL